MPPQEIAPSNCAIYSSAFTIAEGKFRQAWPLRASHGSF